MFDSFVDIGGIDEHHCLKHSFHVMIINVYTLHFHMLFSDVNISERAASKIIHLMSERCIHRKEPNATRRGNYFVFKHAYFQLVAPVIHLLFITLFD
jgi:hypothetical protein